MEALGGTNHRSTATGVTLIDCAWSTWLPKRGIHQCSRLKHSYEFHFEGLSNFSSSIERLLQIQRQSKNIEMKYKIHIELVHGINMVHVSSIMWRIKNQPSNFISCSDNAVRLLVLVASILYWGLQVTSSFSIWGCVFKGCFERGIFWRAKSCLKGNEDFNLEHWYSPLLDQYIGDCLVSIITITNGTQEPPRGIIYKNIHTQLELYIMRELSYLDKFTMVSIWFEMVLTQVITQVYKDSLTLTYPSNINFRLVLWFSYPHVGFCVPLLIIDTMHSLIYRSNIGIDP